MTDAQVPRAHPATRARRRLRPVPPQGLDQGHHGRDRGGIPEEIVDALFADLAWWASTPRWSGSGFTRFAIELADLPGHPARVIARRHKAMLEAHLAELLARMQVASPHERAREIWLLLEGTMAMILVHRDPSYAAASAAAARRLVDNTARRCG